MLAYATLSIVPITLRARAYHARRIQRTSGDVMPSRKASFVMPSLTGAVTLRWFLCFCVMPGLWGLSGLDPLESLSREEYVPHVYWPVRINRMLCQLG